MSYRGLAECIYRQKGSARHAFSKTNARLEKPIGHFLLETQALRLYNRLFHGLSVTGTHGLDVEVNDLLAFLAKDVGDGLFHLLHGDAEIRHRGT